MNKLINESIAEACEKISISDCKMINDFYQLMGVNDENKDEFSYDIQTKLGSTIRTLYRMAGGEWKKVASLERIQEGDSMKNCIDLSYGQMSWKYEIKIYNQFSV